MLCSGTRNSIQRSNLVRYLGSYSIAGTIHMHCTEGSKADVSNFELNPRLLNLAPCVSYEVVL